MAEIAQHAQCPDCGTSLSDEPWAAGLCLRCLAQLAVEAPSVVGKSAPPGEAPTLAYSEDSLAEGQILGNRYRVSTLLGRGGMGEVWRAYDLKLRVDVALKALRPALLTEERALEALRQEVRSAREVISPNVCRVFDLVELEGQELVSMEYIDGITLADILKMRAPLDLAEAREIASQFLAGLEAIHAANLVHRDMKPENLMMTRSGRVVVMDFGIAKGLAEGRAGTISGTPAYMAPEQARGQSVDARADVFSAGVVLAEMISPGGIATHEARASIWEGVHHEPPVLPDSPWAAVLKRAVAPKSAQRYPSASALARALEEVTLRVEGAETVKPYPGLASFTPEDAEYFFGRELEVEEMWKKLRRPHLLGLIGPSGAGKSSFVGAGLLPVIPTGWRVVVATPGNRPFMALGQALVSELSGDDEAMKQLLRFEEVEVAVSLVSQWRQKHDQVLIVIDQFEELFTQNPDETQGQFAELLGRLALEADAHVLLSMRDDFLFHCQRFEPLKPLFSELTPLGTLSGGALRRALVQPALKCGYKFEDDALVDEMVGEVGQERGALPMLAFAASRLWEYRDRDNGLLPREGYERIGGVGGALAQHAEQTLEQIGQDHIPIVRELFRNLVTAQGTRAARDRDDLLSVFSQGDEAAAPARGFEPPGREPRRAKTPGPSGGPGERGGAEKVLDTLTNARLLTSYEVPAADEGSEPHQRIEIIHESLLSNWPRLVHWQAQDEEGALLRDQLRQAAQIWEERGKPEDLLWTGTSFKEYELWRERYSGGVSSQEEEFATAMIAKAERNRRRRRLILAAVITALAVGLTVVGGLWRAAERSRQRAEAETLRAEASKLLALGQLKLEGFPTGALAYAIKSLELTDTPEGRRFALGILWRGPVARILPGIRSVRMAMSPDGEWLAVLGDQIETISADGSRYPVVGYSQNFIDTVGFSLGGEVLYRVSHGELEGGGQSTGFERWTLPGFEALPVLEWDGRVLFDNATMIGLPAFRAVEGQQGAYDAGLLPAQSLAEPTAALQPLGRLSGVESGWWGDRSGRLIVVRRGQELLVRPFEFNGTFKERRIGRSQGEVRHFQFSPDSTLIASSERQSEQMYIWSVTDSSQRPLLELDGNRSPDPLSHPAFAHDNSQLVMTSTAEASVHLWDLEVPLDGRPLILPKKDGGDGYLGIFHPEGHWLATLHGFDVALWPMDWPYVRSVSPQDNRGFAWLRSIAFSPDSKWLASCSGWSGLHLWPLAAGLGSDRSVQNSCLALTYDSSGERLLTGGNGFVAFGSVTAKEPEHLLESGGWFEAVAIDPPGQKIAAAPTGFLPESDDAGLWVWDSDGGEPRKFDVARGCPPDENGAPGSCLVNSMGFAVDGSLYTGGPGGVRRWKVDTGEAEWIVGPNPEIWASVFLTPDGRYLLTGVVGSEAPTPATEGDLEPPSELQWKDLETGAELRVEGLPSAGVTAGAMDPTGQNLAIGTQDGAVWLRRVSGGELHLLLGLKEGVEDVEFSADGRWIAAATGEEILLWPMPDLDRPPFHTLPYEELLARLRSFTNVRAVEDPESSTGWSLEVGPFPGWQDHPTW